MPESLYEQIHVYKINFKNCIESFNLLKFHHLVSYRPRSILSSVFVATKCSHFRNESQEKAAIRHCI